MPIIQTIAIALERVETPGLAIVEIQRIVGIITLHVYKNARLRWIISHFGES